MSGGRSRPAVHQFLTTFVGTGDAVSNHVLLVREALDEAGFGGSLFVEHDRSPHPQRHTRPIEDHPGVASDGDLLVYTLAVGSVLGDLVRDRREPLVVDFHNVTPPEYFTAWPPEHGEPDMTWAVEWGLRQRDELAGRATAAITVSTFNQTELIAAGYPWTEVVPILFDPAQLGFDGDGAGEDPDDTSEPGTRWLFVGRIAPNKCQHEIVLALAAYREVFDPSARLDLVGAVSSQRYERALRATIDELGLGDAVTLTGPVSNAALGARYRAADVFVCLSRHEGFCVPLLEAMHHRIPVVARRAGAVPETAGDGAVILDDPGPLRVAGAVAAIRRDAGFRHTLIDAGRARVDAMSLTAARNRYLDVIDAVCRTTGRS